MSAGSGLRTAPAPARACAYAVIRRVFERGAFADRALHAEAAGLDPRDRALATRLAYGTVQRRRTLDHVVASLSSRPPERLDPPVLAALRLGTYELLLTGGVADHAAVNDAVELAKRAGPRGHGLVNAVLRRTAREGAAILEALTDSTPREAAIRHSVPDWIAELWWRELGADEARALLATVNEPAESALRLNTLKAREAAVEIPVQHRPAGAELPEGVVLEQPFDVFGSPLWRDGLIAAQSRASMLVSRILDPQPGERVLDLCAAPGSKTTHLAALMGGAGEIVAVEAQGGRAAALRETCARMGASNVRVVEADGRALGGIAATSAAGAAGGFDRVLVDPPCSGLGTLQSRPDLRWQERRGDRSSLIALQTELLTAGALALKPGGTLVYSVCTISREEGELLVARVPRLTLEQTRQLLPHRDRTDGFFVARLRGELR